MLDFMSQTEAQHKNTCINFDCNNHPYNLEVPSCISNDGGDCTLNDTKTGCNNSRNQGTCSLEYSQCSGNKCTPYECCTLEPTYNLCIDPWVLKKGFS